MNPGRGLPRAAVAAVLLAGALLAGGLSAAVASAKPAPAPPAGDAIIDQPFAADSGDTCGFTKGILGWYPGGLAVDVNGTVADHPLPGETNPACPQDGRSTTATFTFYPPNFTSPPRQVTKQADDGQLDFTFSFPSRVQQVTVQVCRHGTQPAPLPTPPAYCGPKQAYRPPTPTPAGATTRRSATAWAGDDQPED